MDRSNEISRRPALLSMILCLPLFLVVIALQTALQSCHTRTYAPHVSSNNAAAIHHPNGTIIPGAAKIPLSGQIHAKTRLTHAEVTRTVGRSRLLSPMVPYLMGVLGDDMEFRVRYSVSGPGDELMQLSKPRLVGFKGLNLALPTKWRKHLKLRDGARIKAKTRWMVTRWAKPEEVVLGGRTIRHRGYYYQIMALIDVNIGDTFFYTFVPYKSSEKLGTRCKAPNAKATPPQSDTFDAPEIEDPMRSVKL